MAELEKEAMWLITITSFGNILANRLAFQEKRLQVKHIRINVLVVNLLKKIQPIRWMVHGPEICNRTLWKCIFITFFFFFFHLYLSRLCTTVTALLTTFKKTGWLLLANSWNKIKNSLTTVTTIRKLELKLKHKKLKTFSYFTNYVHFGNKNENKSKNLCQHHFLGGFCILHFSLITSSTTVAAYLTR